MKRYHIQLTKTVVSFSSVTVEAGNVVAAKREARRILKRMVADDTIGDVDFCDSARARYGIGEAFERGDLLPKGDGR